jgi:hypothetical protein
MDIRHSPSALRFTDATHSGAPTCHHYRRVHSGRSEAQPRSPGIFYTVRHSMIVSELGAPCLPLLRPRARRTYQLQPIDNSARILFLSGGRPRGWLCVPPLSGRGAAHRGVLPAAPPGVRSGQAGTALLKRLKAAFRGVARASSLCQRGYFARGCHVVEAADTRHDIRPPLCLRPDSDVEWDKGARRQATGL